MQAMPMLKAAQGLMAISAIDPLPLPAMVQAICSLFDHIVDVQAWIKDREGCYRFVNRGFLLNYGLESAEHALGKTDFDLSPAHIAAQFRMDDRHVLGGQRISGRIELVGRYDHTAVWCVTHKVPLQDQDGIICATAGTTSPLTERAPEPDLHDVAIGHVVGLLQKRYAEKWSNEALAHEANLSVRAFERRFVKVFRVSPQQYLRRLRAGLSARELVYANQPLAAIAARFGFADQSHFTREFRRETGMTPAQYRKQFGR
jgi:AraC-like DNA-binding protein